MASRMTDGRLAFMCIFACSVEIKYLTRKNSIHYTHIDALILCIDVIELMQLGGKV